MSKFFDIFKLKKAKKEKPRIRFVSYGMLVPVKVFHEPHIKEWVLANTVQ